MLEAEGHRIRTNRPWAAQRRPNAASLGYSRLVNEIVDPRMPQSDAIPLFNGGFMAVAQVAKFHGVQAAAAQLVAADGLGRRPADGRRTSLGRR